MDQNRPLRRIRTYVLRQGRLTSGQAYALKHFWQLYGIDYSPTIIDLEQVFGRSAPKAFDIGAGMGHTSIGLASAHPENDYLAVEVHQPGVGSLLRQARAQNIGNIRVICNDVMEVLTHQISDRSFDHVYIFFPDPWPKKRHHKRRLISSEFLTLLTNWPMVCKGLAQSRRCTEGTSYRLSQCGLCQHRPKTTTDGGLSGPMSALPDAADDQ